MDGSSDVFGAILPPPHSHSLYAEYEALIELQNLNVIRGSLQAAAIREHGVWVLD
jgi:hypothetical protein